MSFYDSSPDRDNQPLTWWKGYPIYSATLLVIVHVGMLLLWTVVVAANREAALGVFAISTDLVFKGWVWQPLTYALVHPPGSTGQMVWFAIEMYFLFTFGREVERFFGRRIFWQLYILLWLLAPATLLLVASLASSEYFGSRALHFSLFIAFATIFPNARFIFGLPAKWVAAILIAAEFIQDVAYHLGTSMLMYGVSIVAAYGFVRYQKGDLEMPRFALPRRKPKFRVLPPPPSRPAPRIKVAAPVTASMDDVDALLDKIARTGLDSLSPLERARLERASADLKKRPEPL